MRGFFFTSTLVAAAVTASSLAMAAPQIAKPYPGLVSVAIGAELEAAAANLGKGPPKDKQAKKAAKEIEKALRKADKKKGRS